MTIRVVVRLTEDDVAALDVVVASGRFADRSDALRAGLARVLSAERERELDAGYSRGHGETPQEAWVGEIGLAGLAAFDHAEGGEGL
jgi:Arc/MetJ-type ribon-helix-helix transcriptional regulator